MRASRRVLWLALLISGPAFAAPRNASLAPASPPIQEAPLPGDAMGVSIHRLPNGLTVYLSPNHEEPRIAARIAVRAGSKDDPPESTGIAHYLEHMLFKGTHKLGTLDYEREEPHLERIQRLYDVLATTRDPERRHLLYKEIDAESIQAAAYAVPNEIGKFYQIIGGNALNAHTSYEETVFQVNIPSNRLEAWATAEAERFKNPVFRLFQTELEAVYEEKNRSMDNADAALEQELLKGLYPQHPYGIPILGTVEHLKNPSLSRMREFYERWYVPNNMAIALSGDFDPAQAMDIIRRHFGSWTARPLPLQPSFPLPVPKGEQRRELRFEAEEAVLAAWPAVPANSPDADALEVMDMIADNAAAGLFNLRLNQAQLVKFAGSGPMLYNDAGAWLVEVQPKKDQTPEEALLLALQTIEALKNGEFEASDIAAVITNFEIQEKRSLESDDSRAERMIRSFIRVEPWQREVEHLERLRRVSKEEVVRVARRYLGNDRVVIIRRNGAPNAPKIAKPGFTKVSIDPNRRSAFLKELLALPAPPIEPYWLVAGRDYQVHPIEGGRMISAPNPDNDLFQLSIRFERGWRSQRKLCEALELLDFAGAGPYSAEEFKRRLFALGSSLSYSCGEQESGVLLEGVDRNFWPSIELMAERFDWPNLSTGTLSRMIDIQLGERQDEKKNPGAVYHALGQWARRGADSPILGRLSDAELKSLKEGELVRLMRDFPRWSRRVGYVGPRSPSEAAKLLESNRSYHAVPAREPLRFLKPPRDRVLFTHRDMVQAQVGLFAADSAFNPETAVDDQFYSEYLGGGMSSLIFQEVRESRALAYHAAGGHGVDAHKGDETELWGAAGCQADKTVETAQLLRELLRDPPFSKPRFEETARSIDESYRTERVRFRAVPETVMDWEDEGFDADPRPQRFQQARAYTLDQLKNFAVRFKQRPMTIWILGDRGRVDLSKLKTLGDYEEKSLDSLFPY